MLEGVILLAQVVEEQRVPQSPLFPADRPLFDTVGIHLDLKGVPPTAQRLLSLLDVFAAARYNAVLVEWEDMFPWTCDPRFRSETAYTPDEVTAFLAKAKQLHIEVIPLVQCLGHMETPLKFPEYAHLREVPDQTSVLNPLAPGARQLVQNMMEDVLALMPDIKYFHLGGDEAWSFGTHPDTKAYIEEHGKGALFLQHIEPLLDELLARNIRPILWHDMIRTWESPALNKLKEKADICVWGYQKTPDTVDPERHFHVSNIERLHDHNMTLWGGTAYKGGDGGDLDIPNYSRRLENILGWADVGTRFSMKGMFVTGWSRYCTMVTQLSPIDSSLDFLVLASTILHTGKEPETGLEACVDFLKQIGEYELFARCRQVINELSQQKLYAWEHIRLTRENTVCSKLDPTRCDQMVVQQALDTINGYSKNITALMPKVKEAFVGLVPDIWMERYVGDRLLAIQEELEDVTKRLAE